MNYSNDEILAALEQLKIQYGDDHPALIEFTDRLSTGEFNSFEMTHEPVGIEEFISDPYFMGGILDEIWPKTIESVKEVIRGGYAEAVFDGSIGRAKTTRATIVAAYNLYVLSCYKNPQRSLGLMSNSSIYGVMINKNETLARKVTYAKFRKLIELIPYFLENFMFDKSVDSEMRFPNDIFIIPTNADNDKLLGMDVLFGIVDEINFYDVTEKSKRSRDGGTFDQAMLIYDGMIRRIKSRFEGINPSMRGCISVVSSRAYKGDFTDRKIKQIECDRIEGKKIHTYISTGSYWTFAPQYRKDGTKRYSDETFYVAIGTNQFRSEIIKTPIDTKGREVISVPETFRDGFEKDIEGALRDHAGMVSGSTGSYFSNPEIVHAAIGEFFNLKRQRMFEVEEYDLEKGMPPFNPEYRLPNPSVPRFLHLDLSRSSDNTGIGIAHSVYDTTPRTKRSQSFIDFEPAPIIEYDDFIAITPPKNGEIDYALVRKFIYLIKDKTGMRISWVSADSYQSKDMLSILKRKLICDIQTISVEDEESYKILKNAFAEGRVVLPNHELMVDELLHVVKQSDGNINHLPNRSKDVCDTAAGCYKNMLRVYESGKLYLSGRSNLANLYNRSR